MKFLGYFTTKNTLQKWQKQLLEVVHISGKIGDVDAKTKLIIF